MVALLFLAGLFGEAFSTLLFQLDLVFRILVLKVGPPWFGVLAYLTIPVLTSAFLASQVCSFRGGGYLVGGAMVADLLLGLANFDAFLHCGAFGYCGNGIMGWHLATAFLPYALGKAIALRQLHQRSRAAVELSRIAC